MTGKGAMQSLHGCTTKEKKVVEEIVTMLKQRNIRGTNGPWESFLVRWRAENGPEEPSECSRAVLTALLETITDEKDIQMVKRFYSWITNNENLKEFQQIIDRKRVKFPVTPEEKLVHMTWAHPRFQHDFKFESYNEGWIHSEGGMTADQKATVNLLSLDCEMVDCKGGTRELVSVCLVDQGLKTLVDTLVRPSKKVVDYKSKITGLSARDLKSVTVTQTDVQKQVEKWLVPGTILVGHSLHNDLKALKIDHRRVIDTQYIFPVHGRSPFFCLGLRDLCKIVLGYDFRENDKPHVCLDDAKIPMKLVLHRLQHGPSLLQITCQVDENLLSKLLIHKIPAFVTTDDLIALFPNFTCQIQDVQKVGQKYSKNTSKYAVFQDKMDADKAFGQLQGFIGADITARLQKSVFFHPRMHQMHDNKVKVEICVRKMGFENHDTKQASTSKLNVESIETASRPSMISESVPPGTENKKGVEGVEETAGMLKPKKRKKPCQDYVETLGMEPLSVELSRLPNKTHTGNSNKIGVVETAEKAKKLKKAKKQKKQKKSPVEDVAVEPSALPGRRWKWYDRNCGESQKS